MTNEWTKAQDNVMDTLKEETIARVQRYRIQTGKWPSIEETYDRVCEQFIKGLQYLTDDLKESIIEDVDHTVTVWGEDL